MMEDSRNAALLTLGFLSKERLLYNGIARFSRERGNKV